VVAPSIGTSTDLTVVTGNTATIEWDGPVGFYSVTVQVIDGNGCISESISQQVNILEPGDLTFAAALPSTQTCSDLEDGSDGSVPGQSESLFRITYAGDATLTSANLTVKNPDGLYTELDGTVLADQNNPEITTTNTEVDNEIDIAVTDSWENTTEESVVFEINLVSAIISDNSVINANVANDVRRTITVLTKPVIEFQ
jgi:uncharacterized membrane protein